MNLNINFKKYEPPIISPNKAKILLASADDETSRSYFADQYYMDCMNDARNLFSKMITGTWCHDNEIELVITVKFRDLTDDGRYLGQSAPGNGEYDSSNPLPTIQSFLNSITVFEEHKVALPHSSTIVMNTSYFKLGEFNSDLNYNYKKFFFHVFCHEFFHALGFGSLWNGSFRIVPVYNLPFIPPFILGGTIGGCKLSKLRDQLVEYESALSFIGFQLPPYNIDFNMIGDGLPNDPRYVGDKGRQAWIDTMQRMGGPLPQTDYIPIYNKDINGNIVSEDSSLTEAGGSALSHWIDDSTYWPKIDGHNSLHSMAYELMNAFTRVSVPIGEKNGTPSNNEYHYAWIGKFTAASLEDIGWKIDYSIFKNGSYINLLDWKTHEI